MTSELRAVLTAQHAKHEKLKKKGIIEPWVFWRMVAEGRDGEKKPQPIVSLTKAWKAACREAGRPGRIPHDMRQARDPKERNGLTWHLREETDEYKRSTGVLQLASPSELSKSEQPRIVVTV